VTRCSSRLSRCPEIALAVIIFASLRLAVLDERAIETLLGLALERPQTGQRLVEIAPLALKLADALGDPLKPAPVLRRAGGIRLIEIQVLADGVDGKSQPPQSLDENKAGPVLIPRLATVSSSANRSPIAMCAARWTICGPRLPRQPHAELSRTNGGLVLLWGRGQHPGHQQDGSQGQRNTRVEP